jgi:hypothetical protein
MRVGLAKEKEGVEWSDGGWGQVKEKRYPEVLLRERDFITQQSAFLGLMVLLCTFLSGHWCNSPARI